MRAVLCPAYGPPDVLRPAEVPRPSPGDDEVLIRVRAATVTAGDCEIRRFDLPRWLRLPLRLAIGVRRPRNPILGLEFAGDVAAVGRNATRFREGDPVFGSTGLRFGAYAEYVCRPADAAMAVKPAEVGYEDAATIPTGGLNALHFLRRAHIRAGERVLINGGCGSIGSYAVQLARHYGAEVTAVDAPGTLDVLRSIGADHVIDYTREDFRASGARYDVILDVVAGSPFAATMNALSDHGRLLIANPRAVDLVRGPWVSRRDGKRVIAAAAGETSEDLAHVADLIRAGTLRPFIDRRYPLDELAAAHTYVESGAKRGHVVVTVGGE